jgi:hypothetical protein
MPGEAKGAMCMSTDHNEWTISTLKEHFDMRFEALDKALDLALTGVNERTDRAFLNSEKAIQKEEEKQQAYNKTHNDLSHQILEQNKATMPRIEAEARFSAMDEKIGDVKDKIGTVVNTGKGMAQLWGYIVAAIAVAAFILDRMMK